MVQILIIVGSVIYVISFVADVALVVRPLIFKPTARFFIPRVAAMVIALCGVIILWPSPWALTIWPLAAFYGYTLHLNMKAARGLG